MMEEMPYEELQGWINFFNKRPPDAKDDMRAYRIMQSMGVKESPEALFPSMAIMKETKKGNGLKGSQMLQYLMKAKGGKTLELG